MNLIVGGTGRLGSAVARRLLDAGQPVRLMTRAVDRAESLVAIGGEAVVGDIRDVTACRRACNGVRRVLDAVQAFNTQGGRDVTPRTVDDAGNRQLIDAAKAAGVERFVFTSIMGARNDHPLEFARIKYQIEQYVRASGLSFAILRPSLFMEFWASLVGQPVVDKGRTTVFGRGENPINFVSVEDVADLAVWALESREDSAQIVEIGGPENLTMNQVVGLFERICGRKAAVRHVPLPLMRVMSTVLRPINPKISRLIAAGIFQDTANQTFDASEFRRRHPMQLTRLESVAQRLCPART